MKRRTGRRGTEGLGPHVGVPASGDYDAERAGDVTGEELQRQVPKPARRVPRWFRPHEPVSENEEVVEGALEAVGNLGPLGAVVAIPGAIIAWVRHRRR